MQPIKFLTVLQQNLAEFGRKAGYHAAGGALTRGIVMHLLAECIVDCVMLGARSTLTIMGPKYMQVGHLGASG